MKKYSQIIRILISIIIVTTATFGQKIVTGSSAEHNFFIYSNGDLFAQGQNTNAECGIGSTIDLQTQTKVNGNGVMPANADIIEVAAGRAHSLALSSTGDVYGWGWNGDGQVGDNSIVWRKTPVILSFTGNPNIIKVSAGESISMALDDNGKVYTWGSDTYGKLGNGESSADVLIPTQIGLSNIVDIEAGRYHMLAVGSNGHVYAWGKNTDGELGNNNNTEQPSPIDITQLAIDGSYSSDFASAQIISVKAGRYFSMALDNNGNVYTWGSDAIGKLGVGSTEVNSNIPLKTTLSGISQIAAQQNNAMALDNSGDVWMWGGAANMGLGATAVPNFFTPKNISDDSDFSSSTNSDIYGVAITQISGGYSHSLAYDGSKVYGWTAVVNNYQAPNPSTYPTEYSTTPLSVELTSFTANVDENKVQLNWQTATEVNNYGFEIQRNSNPLLNLLQGGEGAELQGWVAIGFVDGNETATVQNNTHL